MGKRSDSRETVRLALELLRRIPRGRKVTAPELHQQLRDAGIERDLRTIQRQLEMLAEEFHLERDQRSRPYGYRWPDAGRALSLSSLTPQESLLLRLAEEHLRNLLPVRMMRSLDGFFAQARRNLEAAGPRNLEREWPHKVRVVATSQPLLPPKVAPGVFEVACEALYANRWLRIDYRNAAGHRVKTEVMPLGLAQQGARLYLVCRFQGYDDNRTIAVHRLLAAEATTLTFERPKDFDLKRYDDEGRFGFGDGTRVRLGFSISKGAGAHLLETPLSTDQEVKELDDGYRITATVVDSQMLQSWLNGFGDQVWSVRRKKLET